MSALGSLYIKLGEPEGEISGICDLVEWAAEQIERERASRQAAQIESEALKARRARAGLEQQRAVLAERERCAKKLDALGCDNCAAALRTSS